MARHLGLFIVAGALVAVLGLIFFPVFAQSKEAAKTTFAKAEYRRRQIEAQMKAEEAQPQNASYVIPDRSVIRKAELTITVDSIDTSEASLKETINALGGYVDNAEGWDLASPTPSLKVTGRVPVQRFDEVLSKFEKLGHRTAKTVSAEDVTEQVVDMDARMKTMVAQEEVYRGMLRHVNSISQATHMQDTLMNLREQIESISAQRKSLAGQASMSTITVTLEQKADPIAAGNADPNWGGDAWSSALTSASSSLRSIGVAAIWLLAYSPIWLSIAFASILSFRLYKRFGSKVQAA